MKRLERGFRRNLILIAALLTAVGCGGGTSPQQTPIEHDKLYHVRMAESQFNGGRVSEALVTLNEAIERFPDDATLHHRYGLFCLRAARYDEAIPALERSLELDPYLTDAHNILGNIYADQGNSAKAANEYQEALRINPGFDDAHNNLGLAYVEMGRPTSTWLPRSIRSDSSRRRRASTRWPSPLFATTANTGTGADSRTIVWERRTRRATAVCGCARSRPAARAQRAPTSC